MDQLNRRRLILAGTFAVVLLSGAKAAYVCPEPEDEGGSGGTLEPVKILSAGAYRLSGSNNLAHLVVGGQAQLATGWSVTDVALIYKTSIFGELNSTTPDSTSNGPKNIVQVSTNPNIWSFSNIRGKTSALNQEDQIYIGAKVTCLYGSLQDMVTGYDSLLSTVEPSPLAGNRSEQGYPLLALQ